MNNSIRNLIFSLVVFSFALVVVASWPGQLPEEAASNVSASAICANIEPDLSLIAQSAYAVDLQTGMPLFEKNPDAQLPLASLTKLVTVFTASETLSPEDTITISKEALSPEGDAGLKVGEEWKAQDLIDYTLITSANDGVHAIALAAAAKGNETLETFVQKMNARVQALGMHETFFQNDTGLDISSTTASAYGSARDVATLIASILKTNPRLIEGTHDGEKTFTSLSGFTHKAANTSGLIGSLDGGIASKTGYTDLAGGNLAIIFEPIPGRPIAAVVLGSTRSGRDSDMEALAAGAKSTLKRAIICGNGFESP